MGRGQLKYRRSRGRGRQHDSGLQGTQRGRGRGSRRGRSRIADSWKRTPASRGEGRGGQMQGIGRDNFDSNSSNVASDKLNQSILSSRIPLKRNGPALGLPSSAFAEIAFAIDFDEIASDMSVLSSERRLGLARLAEVCIEKSDVGKESLDSQVNIVKESKLESVYVEAGSDGLDAGAEPISHANANGNGNGNENENEKPNTDVSTEGGGDADAWLDDLLG